MAASTRVKSTPEQERRSASFDVGKWIIVAVIALMSLFVLDFARDRIVAPFDNLVTEQMCLRHGEEIERSLLDYGRSTRFALRNRTDGYCSYGPGAEGEAALTMTVEETDPGALYTWAKVIGIIVQLGIASIFIRLVTEPVLETYRILERRLRSSRIR